MFIDPLYKARKLRRAAAEIVRHCKTAGFDAATGIGSAWLRDETHYEDAGAMLARLGFGTIAPAKAAGRGHVFTLLN